LPKPEGGKVYCYPVAAIKAYLKVGRRWTFEDDSVKRFEAKLLGEMRGLGIPKDVFERSVAFGDTLGSALIGWSEKDKYPQTRSASKFSVNLREAGRWRPTSPDYADALEPHWMEIRPMLMDSAGQFNAAPPLAFDTLKSSAFYKEAMEVYQSVHDSTPERIATAKYWDDSPLSTQNAGHVNFVLKKITPGGHWLGITSACCRKKGSSMMESAAAYLAVSVAIFDGFISCWDTKYRYNVIRPESYITKYLTQDLKSEWLPILITPPFPEYTSGHSVVSGASSVVLTQFFGDRFSFEDQVEVQFGMAARSFNSFSEAADQAAISRFYAGIHYKRAIVEGVSQGRNIGKFVNGKLKLHK
jgi:PAP2 superfamily